MIVDVFFDASDCQRTNEPMLNIKEIRHWAGRFKPEVDSWWSAYKIGWLVSKAPQGLNERQMEWPWVIKAAAKEIGRGNRRILDVGSCNTPLPEKLEKLGFKVIAIDRNVPDKKNAERIRIVTTDIRNAAFADNCFDLVTCVSTLEHIGVKGRYGVKKADPDGDFSAMAEIRRILKPGGIALITMPFGKHDVLPVNKCYNSTISRRLFSGFQILKSQYFMFSSSSGWIEVSEAEAETVNWYISPWYALGCFKLTKL
jgi:SAM-dependent methyltransferase